MTTNVEPWATPVGVDPSNPGGHSPLARIRNELKMTPIFLVASTVVKSRPVRRALWLAGAALLLPVAAIHAQTTISIPADVQVRTSNFTYYPDTGLLQTHVVEPAGAPGVKVTTTFHYTPLGGIDTVKTSGWNGYVDEDRVNSTTWDALQRFPSIQQDALNHSVSRTYDPRFGTVLTSTDLNGVVTKWDYDGLGRKIKERRGFANATATAFTDYTVWTYGPNDAPICPCMPINGVMYAMYVGEASYSSADVQMSPVTYTYLDNLGRKIRVSTQVMTSGNVVKWSNVDTVYDSLGRVNKVSAPYFSSDAPQWTTYLSYDELGRVTLQQAPNGIQTQTTYTALAATVTVHSTEGDRARTAKTDGLDRGIENIDAYGKSIFYVRDGQGNLAQTVDNYGNTVVQHYDARERRIAVSDPDLGAWTYTYNAFGDQVLEVDAKNQSTTSYFDKLGRMTERDEGDLISKFSFDTAVHGIGKLAQASTPGYCQTPTYDSLSRLSTTTTNIGGTTACSGGNEANFATSTAYDDSGRVSTLTYPTGVVIQYGYNATVGHLEKVQNFTGGSAGKVYWQWQDADASGRLRAYTYANGVGTLRDFDPGMGWLNSINTGSGTIQSSAYAYDSVGNLAQRSDRFDTPNMVEKTSHDLLGRLTSYALFDAAGQVEQSNTRINLTYDAIGDIKTKSDVGTYYYNPSGASSIRPHAVSEIRGALNASYAYADANGNLTSGASRIWTYTSSNLVASVGNSSNCHRFLYQGDRLRVHDLIYNVPCASADYASPVERTVYLHPDAANGLQFEMDVKGGATTYRHFINAGGLVVGELVSTQMGVTSATPVTMNYFHYDHLGSIVAVTGDAGGLVERRSFDPWGKPRQTSGAPGTGELPNGINEVTDRGFTLAEHLAGLGVIHMNGRVYDPTIGRFSSPDPGVPHADDLQSYNRFAYVENRPLFSTDPTGFDDNCVWLVCFGGSVSGGSGTAPAASVGITLSFSSQSSSSAGIFSNGYTDSGGAAPASNGTSINVTDATGISPAGAISTGASTEASSSAPGAAFNPKHHQEVPQDYLNKLEASKQRLEAGRCVGQECADNLWDLAGMIPFEVGNAISFGRSAYQDDKLGMGVAAASMVALPAFGGGKLLLRRTARDAADEVELLAYGGNGGGHHVPAKSAFKGAEGYDPLKALAIPNSEMARLKINHSLVTGTQMTLYKTYAAQGQKLTWEAMQSIETRALVRGGMGQDMASATVSRAIKALQEAGVASPTRIPWGP